MNDDILVLRAQNGDDSSMQTLLERHKILVRYVTRAYFLTGADGEDLLQEGMIGLYKAILSYSSEKNFSFKKYAELCVKRQVLSAIRSANRLKHLPLNSYISIYKEDEDDNSEKNEYYIADFNNPEEITINKESSKILREKINSVLSNFEKKVLILFLNGDSYADIASSLDKEPKAIDNALQRVKRKLKKFN